MTISSYNMVAIVRSAPCYRNNWHGTGSSAGDHDSRYVRRKWPSPTADVTLDIQTIVTGNKTPPCGGKLAVTSETDGSLCALICSLAILRFCGDSLAKVDLSFRNVARCCWSSYPRFVPSIKWILRLLAALSRHSLGGDNIKSL